MNKVPACILPVAIIALLKSVDANCQPLATFTVNTQPATVAIPVYVNPENIKQQDDSLFVLKDAKEVWKSFAQPTTITIQKNK